MRLKRLTLILTGLALLIGLPGVGQPANDPEPINLSDSGTACGAQDDCQPGLAAQGENVYVVWPQAEEANQSTLYLAKSTDGGETFAPATPIEPSVEGVSQQPDLAVLPDGTLLLAWADDRNGRFDVFITRSTDQGDTWQWDDEAAYLNVSDNEGDSLDPVLGNRSEGRFVIAWSDDTRQRAINPDGLRNIFLRASQFAAEGLTNPVNVSNEIANDSLGARHPDLVVDSSEPLPRASVYVVWERRSRTRDREIFFRQSSPFSTPINVSNSPNDASLAPVIALQSTSNERNRVLVIWNELQGSDTLIMSNSASDAGRAFSAPSFSDDPFSLSESRSNDGSVAARAPSVATNAAGEIFLVWEHEQRGESAIRLRTGLDPFSPPETLSDRDADVMNPVVDVNDTHLYAAWVEATPSGDGFDVYLARQEIVRANRGL